jgi:L-fuconolactonase
MPLEPTLVRPYLEQIASLNDGRIVGLRHSFEFDAPDLPRQERIIASVKLAAEFGFSFDLVLFNRSLAATFDLVKACPEVQFILDHMGKPGIRERQLDPWRQQIADLAACPNIVCKISGATTEADYQHWTRVDLKPYIDHVIASFGWNRVLFGTDWPVCIQAGPLQRWLEVLRWCVQSASEAEQRQLFSETARRIYRFGSQR